ncbi:dynein axonemal intermediate chain 4-like [Harmonia axyridis]|uniref:dynein axonemal intermediate chain 4-like n=1 Tax=Harmonia axyridis TaxID=115357 RepID=UPI001E278672|nr:dynein axonemal intermediate chain 4-like [Harmonia axyridis]
MNRSGFAKKLLSGTVPVRSSLSSIKPKTGILLRSKAIDYNVYYNGQDVTPKPLNQQIFKAGRERQLNVVNMSGMETSSTLKSDMSNQLQNKSASSAGRFKTEIHTLDFNRSFLGNTIDDTFILQSAITDTNTESDRVLEGSDIKSDVEDKAREVIPIPNNISLILNETETFVILDLPSVTEIRDTPEGLEVEKLNTDYEYLTVGKGKNRKVIDTMVQTHGTLRKSRETDAVKVKTTSHTTFASNWEMFDTFLEDESQEKRHVEEENNIAERDDHHRLNETASVESFRQSVEEKELCNLMNNHRFLQAVTVVERLLANNAYNVQQKRFRGLHEEEEGKDIEYKYELDLLWTFANDLTQGKCVTAISWNPANEDIIVVAYGKFYFTDKTNGLVMIWNIKNPVQPERLYCYNESVSAVAFSNGQPHLIAVGFNNGIIEVVDIRERELTVVHRSVRDANASFETVNYLTFYSGDEHYNYEEQILACFNDGRICKYRLNLMTNMPCIQIMRAPEADGKIKGIPKMTVCGIPAIPLTKYTGALLITFHPADPNIYYLCTNTGVIHKCSTNYFNQHLDLLLAHDGPIYQMQFSPFCNKLYVTCGGDWYVRIWAEGIHEPLLELVTSMYPVQYVLWSPLHSTILVAIQSSEIQIWDLHRKVHHPQNIIKSPTGSRNSTIKFTENGKCLTVCDVDGHTHIYSLENMPIPAFFQDHLLYSAIKRNLITKPDLLKKFIGLKTMNFEKTG